MDSHSGMHLSETASVVIHHRSAVVINRMAYYISQGRVETPIRRGGQLCMQFCCKFTSVSVPRKKCQNTMRFDKSYCKIERCNFLPHSV